MMEKKISRGIKIFAWLTIGLNVLIVLVSFNFRIYFDYFKSFSWNTIIIIIFYSILSSLVGVIVGFGLLKLKDVSRRIGIWINFLDLIFGILIFFICLPDAKQYAFKIADWQLIKLSVKIDPHRFENLIFYSSATFTWFVLGLNALFIIFFTRPNIKQQFK